MRNIAVMGLISLTIILGAAFFLTRQKGSTKTNQNEAPQITDTPKITVSASQINDLKAGGSSYTDKRNLYTFLYPNDYVLDTQDPLHTRIYKRGESARPQSEMTDGVIMVFEALNLGGQTLEEYVDSQIAQTSDIIVPKQVTSLNGYTGFTYKVKGPENVTYLFLKKDTQSKSAVSITSLVMDPQQVGYQAQVAAILSTFELHK